MQGVKESGQGGITMAFNPAIKVRNKVDQWKPTFNASLQELFHRQRRELQVDRIVSGGGMPADVISEWENQFVEWFFSLKAPVWNDIWRTSTKDPELKATVQELYDDWIDDRSREIGKELSNVNAKALNQALSTHAVGSVTNLKKELRGSIGLQPQQVTALAKQSKVIRDTVSDTQRAEAMVAKLRQKKINYRADLIARTEMSNAINDSQLDDIKNKVNEGELFTDTTKTWRTRGDLRVCPVCLSNEDETVKLNEAFTSGHGSPTAHPGCHCGLQFSRKKERRNTEEEIRKKLARVGARGPRTLSSAQRAEQGYKTVADVMRDALFAEPQWSFTEAEAIVKKFFPDSKFKKTHWSWYRTQVKKGKFKPKGTIPPKAKPKPRPPPKPRPGSDVTVTATGEVTSETLVNIPFAVNDENLYTELVDRIFGAEQITKHLSPALKTKVARELEAVLRTLPSSTLEKLRWVDFIYDADYDALGYWLARNTEIALTKQGVVRSANAIREMLFHEIAHAIDHIDGKLTSAFLGGTDKKLMAVRKVINDVWLKQQLKIDKLLKKKTGKALTATEVGEGYKKWQDLWKVRPIKGTHYISDYATYNRKEFFAEAVAGYINGGKHVKKFSPELYDLIRDYVFGGVEFPTRRSSIR